MAISLLFLPLLLPYSLCTSLLPLPSASAAASSPPRLPARSLRLILSHHLSSLIVSTQQSLHLLHYISSLLHHSQLFTAVFYSAVCLLLLLPLQAVLAVIQCVLYVWSRVCCYLTLLHARVSHRLHGQ